MTKQQASRGRFTTSVHPTGKFVVIGNSVIWKQLHQAKPMRAGHRQQLPNGIYVK